jgi:hypothetical protein
MEQEETKATEKRKSGRSNYWLASSVTFVTSCSIFSFVVDIWRYLGATI